MKFKNIKRVEGLVAVQWFRVLDSVTVVAMVWRFEFALGEFVDDQRWDC